MNTTKPLAMNTSLPPLLFLTLLLFGCSSQKPPPTAQARPPQPLPTTEPRLQPRSSLPGGYSARFVTGDFAGYPALEDLISRMVSNHGMSRDYLNGLFSQAHRKQWTLNYMNNQGGPSSALPRPGAWSKYRAQFLDDLHINSGVAFWMRHARALQRAQQRYGVPPEYVLGIMGVETIYGRNMGKDRVFDALTTLAFDYPRRSAYFTEELENFLLMTRVEGIDPLEPKGSFAGAMGLGQFMPGSFIKWAVDHSGDGRRDLWHPEDAIGSIAHYFQQHGWRPGEAVVVPAAAQGMVSLPVGYDKQYSLDELASAGVQPEGEVPPGQKPSLLLLRSTNGDQYWLGLNNFFVITRYNHSTHYAMAVHELGQAIKRRYQGGN
jgi:membrane-bound lytic murein transglycosylase B